MFILALESTIMFLGFPRNTWFPINHNEQEKKKRINLQIKVFLNLLNAL